MAHFVKGLLNFVIAYLDDACGFDILDLKFAKKLAAISPIILVVSRNEVAFK